MWNESNEVDLFDWLLWHFLMWLKNNGMLKLEPQPVTLKAGWDDCIVGDCRVFHGLDFWVSDFRSGGW